MAKPQINFKKKQQQQHRSHTVDQAGLKLVNAEIRGIGSHTCHNFSFLKKKILFYVYRCVAYIYVCIPGVGRIQRRMLNPMETGDDVRGGCELVWVLGLKLGYSGRTAS